jgi:hypothetical protein
MKHFTIQELTASKHGVNIPTKEAVENITLLVDKVLDPLREMYGKPIKINSGYRSSSVNKKAGGKPTSQHLKGEAADITAGNKAENAVLFELIRRMGNFDQLINEYDYSWIHVSYKKIGNRKQILAIK